MRDGTAPRVGHWPAPIPNPPSEWVVLSVIPRERSVARNTKLQAWSAPDSPRAADFDASQSTPLRPG